MSKAKRMEEKSLWQQLCELPENMVGEIFNDELITSPRPGPRHAVASGNLHTEINSLFGGGNGSGWRILYEPELHFDKPPQKYEKKNVVVPDIAGWKRDRMPKLPETAYFELPPDWVCEILSPSTARHDRIPKMNIYSVNEIPHYWIVDPINKTLEVFALESSSYRNIITFGENDRVSAPPFEEIEFDLGNLWD